MAGVNRPAIKVEIDFGSGALEPPGTWTDVSAYVTGSIRYRWGREKSIDDFAPGQGSFRLLNNDGRFDPSNASGPYYGQLKPRRKVRISVAGGGTTLLMEDGTELLDEAGAALELEGSATGYVIASGWVQGWPQTPVGRHQVYVDVEFVDFLGLAARLPMPESVYDWQIGQTEPFIWYRMNDTGSTAVDSSGHRRHGKWKVFEGLEQPWQGELMPTAVLRAGDTDPIVIGSGRPGRNWAKMQAEVGQPLGGISGAPRTPCLVCHDETWNLLDDDFTVEFWIIARQAFPLDISNTYSSTTPIQQPVVTWGRGDSGGLYGGGRYEFSISTAAFQPSFNAFVFGGFTSGSGYGYDPMTGGEIHQLVYIYHKATTSIAVYVDSVFRHDYNIAPITTSGGLESLRFPAVIGYATGLPSGLQSTMGDVVFWDRALSAAEILKNYRAGRYANLETSNPPELTVNDGIDHALEMAGASSLSLANDSSSSDLNILPPDLHGKSLRDYLRVLVDSEQGILYWRPGGDDFGRLEYRGRNWPVADLDADTSQITLADTSGATAGYGDVVYRDGADLIANDITASYSGGEQRYVNAASVTDYGPVTGSVETVLTDDERALQVAAFRAWKYGTPATTVIIPERIVISPTTDEEFAFVAKARPCQRFTLTRTRPDSSTITTDYVLDGITHEIDAAGNGAWATTLAVSPADDPGRPFQIGISELDGTDVLWL